MYDLVVKKHFRLAKLKLLNYDFAFWNFKRPLKALGRPKIGENDRTFKNGEPDKSACTAEVTLLRTTNEI